MKVIEKGNFDKEWQAKCPRCGCVFSYDAKDIQIMRHDWVSCPECAQRIDVTDRDNVQEVKEGTVE